MPTRSGPKKIPGGLSIPTLPVIAQRIQRLVDDPSIGTREIGRVLAEDAPLSAKVLRIVNSAFYGLVEPCISPEQACTILGASGLRNAVTQAAVIRQFEHLKATGFDIDALWKHSILTAQACAQLAAHCTASELTPDEFYSCGLLHDIGKIVLLDKLGERYARILMDAQADVTPHYLVEERELGCCHADVGAMVAERWGLPIPVVAAIQFHHGPREAVRDSTVVSLVANTNLLVHAVIEGKLAHAAEVFDAQTLKFLGLAPGKVAETAAYLAEQHMLVEV